MNLFARTALPNDWLLRMYLHWHIAHPDGGYINWKLFDGAHSQRASSIWANELFVFWADAWCLLLCTIWVDYSIVYGIIAGYGYARMCTALEIIKYHYIMAFIKHTFYYFIFFFLFSFFTVARFLTGNGRDSKDLGFISGVTWCIQAYKHTYKSSTTWTRLDICNHFQKPFHTCVPLSVSFANGVCMRFLSPFIPNERQHRIVVASPLGNVFIAYTRMLAQENAVNALRCALSSPPTSPTLMMMSSNSIRSPMKIRAVRRREMWILLSYVCLLTWHRQTLWPIPVQSVPEFMTWTINSKEYYWWRHAIGFYIYWTFELPTIRCQFPFGKQWLICELIFFYYEMMN